MNVSSALRRRVEPSRVSAGLAVGDLVAIAAFVATGEIEHGYSLTGDAGRVVGTLVPFLVGWALVSLAGGLYRPAAVTTLRRVVGRTLGGWVVAVLVAQALRSTAAFPGNASPVFALVSIGVGGALLVTWRLLATRTVLSVDRSLR